MAIQLHSDPASPRASGTALVASTPPAGGEADALGRVAGLFRRRKRLVVTTTLLGTALAILIVMRLTPLYTGETLVMLDHRKTEVTKFDEVLQALGNDMSVIQTEVAVLKSPAFTEKVVDRLGLVEDPEFNVALNAVWPEWIGDLDPTVWLPEAWMSALRGDRPVIALSEAERARNQRTAVVRALIDRIDVRPQGRSYVLAIDVDSEDPRKAARIANTIGELYLVDQLDEKFKATDRAIRWLETRIDDLRRRARQAIGAVETFRSGSGLTAPDDTRTLVAQQLAELNTNYILARTERQTAEARQREVAGLVAGGGGGVRMGVKIGEGEAGTGTGTVGEVLASPLIQALRRQQIEIGRRIADAATRYGPQHPDLVTLRVQRDDLDGQMRVEIAKIVQNLSNEVAVARAREEGLKSSLDQLQARQDQQRQSSATLLTLQREADSAQTVYESLLTRLQEVSAQADIQSPDARVVSVAAIPLVPSFPAKKAIVAGAFLASGALGLLAAVLVERFERGVFSPHQLEAVAEVRGLGLIPEIGGWRPRPLGYLRDRPASTFAESVQALRTALALGEVSARAPGGRGVLLFASSVAEEGKSTLAAALATVLAAAGQRVALVDGDLRRGGLSQRLGLDGEVGLADVLLGRQTLEQAIRHDPRAGLDVLARGRGGGAPQDLLGSPAMADLLARLSREWDHVIVDSSPLLLVSDAKLLAAAADRTVFVVRWGRTRRDTALAGLKELADAGAEVAGVVLSRVDIRRHALLGFPDSGRYHGDRRVYAN